jgi:hypothetical protein
MIKVTYTCNQETFNIYDAFKEISWRKWENSRFNFFPIKKQNFLKSWEKIEQFWFNLVLKMQLSKVLENIALILKYHLDYCITRNDK